MSKRLWGGRFKGRLDERIDKLNRSLPFDRRLFEQDIDGSAAWARALRRIDVLRAGELKTILAGLEKVRGEFRRDRFRARAGDEDIHTAVERRLTELAGEPGRKLHTGRSRNDQVACDLHLWLKQETVCAAGNLSELCESLLDLAERSASVAMPAYTHLQRAQPVLAAHHLLAYVEMLQRDRERFAQVHTRADVLPLGCGAATGVAFPIDRAALAKDLGFKRVARNSMDAVASRDAALEFLAACSICGVHLSRLGEEIVLWTSSEFGFLQLDDRAATGSSLMPQKRNPDAAELARGKAGRLLGHFVALAATLKGLPLAYNKDLQEDKEACFDAADTLDGLSAALQATLECSRFDEERCAAALKGGHLLATELADYLVRKGVPFRQAHEIVGGLVAQADKRSLDVSELPLDVLREAAPEFEADVHKALTIPAALRTHNAVGGTAPARVRRELLAWRKRLVSLGKSPI